MKQALIKYIESLDLYSYTISSFEAEMKWFIASMQDYYSEDEMDYRDLPLLDCKLQTKKKHPKKFKSIYDAVKIASSTDEARQALLGFKVEYNALLATDGRRLISFDYAGPLKPGLYDKNQKPSIDAGFPDYKKYLPIDFLYKNSITAQLYYSARAAQKFYYLARKSGAKACTAVQINAENCVLCLNVDYLIDGLNAIYYANNKSFDGVYLEYISDDRPVRLSIPGTQNFYYLMPMKLDDPAHCEKLNISTFLTIEESITRNNFKPESVESLESVKPESVESLESVKPESQPVQAVERNLSSFTGIEDYLQGLTRKQRKNLDFVQTFDFNGSITTEKRISFINRMHLNGLLTATIRESSSKIHYLVCGQYVGENTYCYARFLLQAAESKQEISA